MPVHTHAETGSQNVEIIDSPSGWFTADEVHDAYLKGEEKGKKHFIEGFNKTLSFNLPIAAKLAEEFISAVEETQGIKIPTAYLRVEGISKFGILFLIPKEKFLSENMRNVYIVAEQFESKDIPFEIYFSFTILSENLKEEYINADGYKLKHVNSSKERT